MLATDKELDNEITRFFHEHTMPYQLHHHQPIFTVEEGLEISQAITGAHSKNLFLKDRKGQFFLVSMIEDKRLDVKTLSKQFGKGGLSFASKEALAEKLKLIPGAVSPFGLIHDIEGDVVFILDKDFMLFDTVNFHPLRNDFTMSVATHDFLTFCELAKHTPHLIEIPVTKEK